MMKKKNFEELKSGLKEVKNIIKSRQEIGGESQESLEELLIRAYRIMDRISEDFMNLDNFYPHEATETFPEEDIKELIAVQGAIHGVFKDAPKQKVPEDMESLFEWLDKNKDAPPRRIALEAWKCGCRYSESLADTENIAEYKQNARMNGMTSRMGGDPKKIQAYHDGFDVGWDAAEVLFGQRYWNYGSETNEESEQNGK